MSYEVIVAGFPLHFWGHAVMAVVASCLVWSCVMRGGLIERTLFVLFVAVFAVLVVLGGIYAIYIPWMVNDGLAIISGAFIMLIGMLFLVGRQVPGKWQSA